MNESLEDFSFCVDVQVWFQLIPNRFYNPFCKAQLTKNIERAQRTSQWQVHGAVALKLSCMLLSPVEPLKNAESFKNCIEVPQKTKNRTTIWSSNSTPGYVYKEDENTNSKRDMYPKVHSSIIYNCQDTEAT